MFHRDCIRGNRNTRCLIHNVRWQREVTCNRSDLQDKTNAFSNTCQATLLEHLTPSNTHSVTRGVGKGLECSNVRLEYVKTKPYLSLYLECIGDNELHELADDKNYNNAAFLIKAYLKFLQPKTIANIHAFNICSYHSLCWWFRTICGQDISRHSDIKLRMAFPFGTNTERVFNVNQPLFVLSLYSYK